jgi:hypothetical protein
MEAVEFEKLINNEFETDVFSVSESYGEFIITGKYTDDYAKIGSRFLGWEIDFRFEKEAGIIISERELKIFLELI